MDIQTTFKEIRALRIQGARNIALAAVHAVAENFESLEKARKDAELLMSARPTEPMMRNYLKLLLRTAKDKKSAINFADERMYEEPAVERAEDKARMLEGLMSIEEYYTKWGAYDTQQTKEEVLEIVKKRQEELKQLNSEPVNEIEEVGNAD